MEGHKNVKSISTLVETATIRFGIVTRSQRLNRDSDGMPCRSSERSRDSEDRCGGVGANYGLNFLQDLHKLFFATRQRAAHPFYKHP